MARILLTAIICAVATEAFTPVPSISQRSNAGIATQLDAAKGEINAESIAKVALTSALSFTLLFGPSSPAFADGTLYTMYLA